MAAFQKMIERESEFCRIEKRSRAMDLPQVEIDHVSRVEQTNKIDAPKIDHERLVSSLPLSSSGNPIPPLSPLPL